MRAAPHGIARYIAARADGGSTTEFPRLSKITHRTISAFLALALALTMCPAAGLAYAAEGDASGAGESASAGGGVSGASGDAADGASSGDSSGASGGASGGHISEDAVLDTSGSASGSSGESASDDADSDPAAGSASSDASSKYIGSGNGQTSADVSLAGDATVGTIEYNGLAYTINENDDSTVSLTGLASSKPTGDVQIPAQIASGGELYAVSAIKVPGLAEDANPYAEEFFDDSVKALAVKSISIPQTVKAIDAAFFQLFPNATDITVSTENETYTSYDGALYDADLTQLILVPQGKGSLVLPSSLASVPAYVFSQCNKLSAITFSGSTGNEFLAVQNNVLYTSDLSTLLAAPAGLGASASIASECTTIAEGAFQGNATLDTIVVNGVVEDIASAGDIALGFDGQPLMEGSQLRSDLSSAGSTTLPAFSEAAIENATIVINASVEADGDEASALIERAKAAWEAYGFTKFKEPAAPGTEIVPEEESGFAFTLLSDYTLSVRWAGATEPPAAIDIPDYGIIDGVQYTVSTIADNGFSNYTSLITADIPQTVTFIGDSAFELCTSLQTVHFDSVVSIGSKAFANTALLSLVLPTTVQSIGDNAFSNMKETTIVALGSIADNSPIALGAASGLSVYVPYGTEDVWDAGIPTLGNHIYPYGVKLSDEPIELEVGQTANITDSGYIEAPGNIEASYAYKANPVSINTDDGTIEAKAAGSTYINVSLELTIDQVAIKGNVSNVMKLQPVAVNGEEESDIVSVPQTISLAADTMNAVMYDVPNVQADLNPEDEILYYSALPIIDPATGNSVSNTDMSKAGWSMTKGGALRIWSADGVRIGAVSNSSNQNNLLMYWNSENWDQSKQANAASGTTGVNLRSLVTSVDTTGIYAAATMNAWFSDSVNLSDVSKFRMPTGVSSADGKPCGTSDIRKLFSNCTKITEFPSGIDMSDANYSFGAAGSERYSALGFFWGCTSLKSIGEGFRLPTSIRRLSEMFLGCTSLTDLGDFELPVGSDSQVYDVNAVFKGCSSLTRLPDGFTLADLSDATISAYSGPVSMFYGCSSLTALPDGFRLPTVPGKWNFTSMFEGCSALAALPEGFELPVKAGSDTTRFRVTNMFAGCDNLSYIPASFTLENVPDVKTSSGVSQLDSMFAKQGFSKSGGDNWLSWYYTYNDYTGTPVPYDDKLEVTYGNPGNLAKLAPSWALSGGISSASQYWDSKYGRILEGPDYYSALPIIDPATGNSVSNTDMAKAGWSMTKGGTLRIWSADGVRIGAVSNPSNNNQMLSYWNSENWDQSKQTNAASGTTGVNLRNLVTSVDTTGIYAVATMQAWFSGSENLSDASKFRMPKGISTTDGKPRGCQGIRKLFGGTSITEFPAGIDMSDANYSYPGSEDNALGFFFYCEKLIKIGDGFRLPTSTKRISELFRGCTSLVDLGDFELPVGSDSNVYDVNAAFMECESLVKLPDGFTLEYLSDAVVSYGGPVSMFYNCKSLASLPDGFRLPIASNKWNFANMFYGCSALAALPEGFSMPDMSGKDASGLRIANMFAGCDSLEYIPASFSLVGIPDVKTSDGISHLDSMFAKEGFSKPEDEVFTTWYVGYNGWSGTPVAYANNEKVSVVYGDPANLTKLIPSWAITGAVTSASQYWDVKYGRTLVGPDYYSALPIIDPATGNSVSNTDMAKAGWSMTKGGTLRIWSADGVRIGAVSNPSNNNQMLSYWNSENWDQSKQTNAASGTTGVNLKLLVNSVDTTGIYAVATMQAWFQGSSNLADVSKFRMPTGVSSTDGQPRGTSDIRRVFGECPKIAEFPAGIDMSDANYTFGAAGSERYSALGFFTGCTSLKKIGAGFRLPTSTQRISEMFLGCTSLTDLGDFELPVGSDSQVYDVNAVFKGCSSLTRLPDGFTLASLTDNVIGSYAGPVSMFYGCSSLTALPDGFRLPTVPGKWNFTSMFEGCSALAALPEGFELPVKAGSDTTRFRITNMFAGCDNLAYIPASFSLENVPDTKTSSGASHLDSMFAKQGFSKSGGDNWLSWLYTYNDYTGTPVPYTEGDTAHNTLFGSSDTSHLAPSWALTGGVATAKQYWSTKYGRIMDSSSEVRVMYYFPNEPLDPTKGFRLSSVAGLNAWGQPNLPSMDPVTGYRVQDWYTDPYYDNVFGFGTQLTKTTQLYAKFYPFSYDISFNAQGSVPVSVSAVSRNPETMSVQEGSTFAEPVNITMLGYDLDGWYVGNTNVKWDFSNDVVTGAMTLTAHWTPIEFIVNLDYANASLNSASSPATKQVKATITGSFVLPNSTDAAVLNRGHEIAAWEHSDIWFDKISVGADESWGIAARTLIDEGHLSNSRREISFSAAWKDSAYSVTLHAFADKSASVTAPDAKLTDSISLSSLATGDAFKAQGSGEGYPQGGYAITGWVASASADPMTASKIENTDKSMDSILALATGDAALDAPLSADGKRHVELYAVWTPVYSTTLPVGATDEASFTIDLAKSTDTILADANVNMTTRTRADLEVEAKSVPAMSDPSTAVAEAVFDDLSKVSFDYRQKDAASDSTEDVAEADRIPFAFDGKDAWVKVATLAASADGKAVDNFGDLYLTYKGVKFGPDAIDKGALSKDWGELARIEWRASMKPSSLCSYVFTSPTDPRISGV